MDEGSAVSGDFAGQAGPQYDHQPNWADDGRDDPPDGPRRAPLKEKFSSRAMRRPSERGLKLLASLRPLCRVRLFMSPPKN